MYAGIVLILAGSAIYILLLEKYRDYYVKILKNIKKQLSDNEKRRQSVSKFNPAGNEI